MRIFLFLQEFVLFCQPIWCISFIFKFVLVHFGLILHAFCCIFKMFLFPHWNSIGPIMLVYFKPYYYSLYFKRLFHLKFTCPTLSNGKYVFVLNLHTTEGVMISCGSAYNNQLNTHTSIWKTLKIFHREFRLKKNKCYVSKLVTDWKSWPKCVFF